MTFALRQRCMTQGTSPRPLLDLHRWVRAHGIPEPDSIAPLAQQLGMPAAEVRAALSYYSDLHSAPDALRVCRGTSCELAGAARLASAISDRARPSRMSYCLGFCDRSPVALLPDERVAVHCEPTEPRAALASAVADPGPPSIRCGSPEPIVTRHILDGDHADLGRARAAGVYRTVEAVLARPPEEIVTIVERSGERGRGGAAFPTGTKWRRCAAAAGSERYVVANGDEGDPGSYIDRVLLEMDPHSVLEGMLLCAHAIRATRGVVFIRSEYPRALACMERAVAQARAAGLLGPSALGSERSFDVEVVPGLGSYVCGEETALLNAIEGFRGDVRPRPPYPVERGLFGHPTVVNNVETLAQIPWIVARGAAAYRAFGTKACPGTKALCFNWGFARPGIVEVELGTPLATVIEREAGGAASGAHIDAVLVGGPMGSVISRERWNLPVCYAAMREKGVELGHGGMIALLAGTDVRALLLHWLEFMHGESCGKCAPCRIGSKRALDMARADPSNVRALLPLLEMVGETSLCAFGQRIPVPLAELIARCETGSEGGL
jgi:NADH:ubiquinone oxidoreductase subunit F (NADH-binding)/NADH:ubiquinone oxidoreductase subunit E